MKEFEGRTGIVTGGSSGIGYAIANVLAENGATVYVISRTGKEKEGLAPSAPGVIHVKGDVTDYDAMKKLIGEIAGKIRSRFSRKTMPGSPKRHARKFSRWMTLKRSWMWT